MEVVLRAYQSETVEKVVSLYKQNPHGSAKFVWATGLGKTVGFSAIAHEIRKHSNTNVLIIAHRDELLQQAMEKYRFIDPSAVIGKVGGGTFEWGAPVTVASIQTISRDNHLKQLKLFNYGVVIIDECHHCHEKNEYGKVLEALPDAFKIGVTATDMRLDKRSNNSIFGEAVCTFGIRWAIQHGHLCNLRAKAIATDVSLDALKTGKNMDGEADFQISELAGAVDTASRNARIVNAWKQYANGRRTICFGVTVEHAKHITEAFTEAGIAAATITGETEHTERKRLYKALADGSLKVLSSVQVLTEGFDSPRVNCIIMARPTQSESLFIQCLDEQTEILTPDGWKSRQQIKKGDLVAGFDKDTEEIAWVPALSKVERPLALNEKMYELDTPSLNFRVTGGHRMLYRIPTTNNGKRVKSEWSFMLAEDLASRTNMYEVPIAGFQDAPGVPLTDDELRFVGWFLTDGGLNKKTNSITISQAAHQPYHKNIQECLVGCGFKYGVYECTPDSQFHVTSNSIRYSVSKGMPRGRDKHLTGWARLEEYIDKDFSPALQNMTTKQLEILLETINQADGAKQHKTYISHGKAWTRQSYTITKGNKLFAERLQSLCIRRGFKCNVSTVKKEGYQDIYHIHIKKIATRAIGGNKSKDRPTLAISPSIPGETVWCVENTLGTLVTRRNGKVTITGNCIGRGLRLAPGKEDCLLLDITDNCFNHKLEPQSLSKVLGLKLKDNESVVEAEKREKAEKAEREAQVRKLNTKRESDLEVNLLEVLAWKERDGGLFVLEVGREKHRIALAPTGYGTYDIYARLFPGYEGQQWAENLPLDWAQQMAEKKARMLLADPKAIALVDRNASWRNDPASEKMLGFLRWKKIPYDPEITKGEAGDLIDEWKRKDEQKQAAKEARKSARVGV